MNNIRTTLYGIMVVLFLSTTTNAQVYTSEVEVKADANGNVGIGTTTPADKLSIDGGKLALYWNDGITIYNTSDAYPRISSTGQNGSYPFSVRGNLVFQSRPIDGADIVFAVGSNPAAKMVVKGTGLVGIGNSSPKSILTIGSNTSDIVGTTGITLGKGHGNIEFVHSTYSSGYGSKIYSIDEGNGNTSLRIATRGKTTTWSDALYIRATDNSTNTRIGIGTINPSYKLDINGSARATTWYTTSDERLKKNIRRITRHGDLSRIKSYQYEMTDANEQDRTHFGFLAQEIELVYPELVATDSLGFKAVAYQEFIPLLIDKVNEQSVTISDLVEINNELRDRIIAIEEKIKK